MPRLPRKLIFFVAIVLCLGVIGFTKFTRDLPYIFTDDSSAYIEIYTWPSKETIAYSRDLKTGKYRVISKGWFDQNRQNIPIWDYAEFTVE